MNAFYICRLLPYFFFNDTATTEIYTLSLHDALPISYRRRSRRPCRAGTAHPSRPTARSEEHTSELQSHVNLVCRLLLEKKKQLTKPAGSLGRLEDIAIHIAGITRQPLPRIQRKAVIIMAGDHGVTSEGVSAYPSAVTPQMVHNFLQSGAAINALARYVGAKVIVVDVGVAADIAHPDLLSRKVAFGTANMMLEPAMTHAQMLEAIQA